MDNTIRRGSLSQMIQLFSQSFHVEVGEEGSGERIAALCTIFDAPRSTVEHWFKHGTPPWAMNARRIELVLSLCGFEAEERSKLSPMIRTFIDTLATVVSVDEAAKELGGTPDNILNWVRATTQPKRSSDVIEFNGKHAARREAKVKQWKKLLHQNGFITEPKAEPAPQVPSVSIVDTKDLKSIDEAIIHQMKALRAMITSSDVLSDDARKKGIRQSVGHNEVAELIGDLQRLSLAPFTFNNHP